jgi:hypothetical protein
VDPKNQQGVVIMNKKVTTTRTNLKLLSRRKQQGNTLVPVVIGLGIAAVATVAFLNQGDDLVADNNRVIATNEVATILNDYNTIRATGVAAENVTAIQIPALATTNFYTNTNSWTPDASNQNGVFIYITDSPETCQRLLATFTGAQGVDDSASTCTNQQLDLTLN